MGPLGQGRNGRAHRRVGQGHRWERARARGVGLSGAREKRGAGLLRGERVSAGWAACERGFGLGKWHSWAKRAEGEKGKAGRAVAGSFGPGFGFWLVFLF